jgi:hypothetical protein
MNDDENKYSKTYEDCPMGCYSFNDNQFFNGPK